MFIDDTASGVRMILKLWLEHKSTNGVVLPQGDEGAWLIGVEGPALVVCSGQHEWGPIIWMPPGKMFSLQ